MAGEHGAEPSTSLETLGPEPARGILHPISGQIGKVPNFGVWGPFGPEASLLENQLDVLKRIQLSYFSDQTLKNVNPGGPDQIWIDGNGSVNYLHVGAYDIGNPTHPHRAFLMFPTSGLSGTVVSAKCRFYHRGAPDTIGHGDYQLWVAQGNEIDKGFGFQVNTPDWNVIYPLQTLLLIDAGCNDTYLSEATPATNFSTSTVMRNLNAGVGTDQTTILKFLAHGVPSTATVISATLTLSLGTAYGDIPQSLLYAQRLLQDFVNAEASWNEYSAGNAWNTAGAAGLGTDYSDTDQVPFTVTIGDPAGEQWVLNVTDIVQAQISAAETDIKFRIREQGSGNVVVLASTDHPTGAWRPKLTINYQLAGTTGTLAAVVAVSNKTGAPTFNFSPAAVQVLQDAADAGEELHVMLKAVDENEMVNEKLALISADEIVESTVKRPKLIVIVDEAAPLTGFPGQHNRHVAQLMRP
jgi:hypothetical protein